MKFYGEDNCNQLENWFLNKYKKLMTKINYLEGHCVRVPKSLRGKSIILSLPIKAIILFSLSSTLSPCTPLTSLSWLQRYPDCLFPCWIRALWDRSSNSDFSFSISLPAIIAWMVSSFQTVIPLFQSEWCRNSLIPFHYCSSLSIFFLIIVVSRLTSHFFLLHSFSFFNSLYFSLTLSWKTQLLVLGMRLFACFSFRHSSFRVCQAFIEPFPSFHCVFYKTLRFVFPLNSSLRLRDFATQLQETQLSIDLNGYPHETLKSTTIGLNTTKRNIKASREGREEKKEK